MSNKQPEVGTVPDEDPESAYRLVVENAHESIVIAQDGDIKRINARGEALFGYSAAQLTQMPFTQFIHPDDKQLVLSRHKARLASEDRSIPETYSFRIIDGHGQTKWVAVKVVVTTWRGRPATLNFLRDVTEHKTVAAERDKLENQLRQSQRLGAVGRLAGGMAHDMNNVLSIILGLASLLESEMEPDDKWLVDIQRILAACEHGRELTSNLLGFARKGTFVKRPIMVNEVATRVQDLLKRAFPERIVLNLDLCAESDGIEGDPNQLAHALMNICLNAADAITGTGTITVSSANVVLGASDLTDVDLVPGPYVRLAVTDTGDGMAAETMERAFEPFYTTKPDGEGTGLGLAMVYGTMKEHGGAVTIDSRQGQGTTVSCLIRQNEVAKPE